MRSLRFDALLILAANLALSLALAALAVWNPIKPAQLFAVASLGMFVAVVAGNYKTFKLGYLTVYASIWACLALVIYAGLKAVFPAS